MMRLDAMVRIDATCDRMTVNLDAPAATVVTLTAGLYSPDELAAHIEDRLQAVDDAAWTCTLSAAGVYTLAASGHTLYVTWTRPALRDALGWAANISGASNTATAPAVSPCVFVPALPWHNPAPVGWRVETSRSESHRHLGRAFRRSQVRTWEVTARAMSSEVAQLRGVLERIARGVPGRWYRHTSVTTAWAWTSPSGYVDVHLVGDWQDRWLDAGGARTVVEIPLQFVERTP